MDVPWRTSLVMEMKSLFRIAMPMTITQSMYGVVYPVTLAFCGSLGTDQIDQASLAMSIYQLFVVSVENGLRWTSISFIGQVKRTASPHRVGIFLQRAIFAAVICWLVGVAMFINTANFLILIGQIRSIAIGAETFIMILMPGCLGVLVFRILMAYMDSLKVVYPSAVIQGIFCVGCFSLEYLLVNHTNLGVVGAAIALSVSQCSMPLMLLSYIRVSKIYKETWKGWSRRGLMKWDHFFRHLMPTVGCNVVYFLATEIGTFLAGTIGKKELAAQSILFQVYILCTQIPFGLVSAGMVRITQHVSRKNVRLQRIGVVALFLELLSLAVLFGTIVLSLRYYIPRLFTSDETVIALYVKLTPYLAVYAIFLISSWHLSVTFRSYNRNSLPLIVTIVNFFMLGHPIGISLMYAANMGMEGLWIGYAIGAVTWLTNGTLVYVCIDWQRETTKVMSEMGHETDIEMRASKSGIGERAPLLEDEIDNTKVRQRTHKATRLVARRLALFGCMFALVCLSLIVRVVYPPQLLETEVFVNLTKHT